MRINIEVRTCNRCDFREEMRQMDSKEKWGVIAFDLGRNPTSKEGEDSRRGKIGTLDPGPNGQKTVIADLCSDCCDELQAFWSQCPGPHRTSSVAN